MRINAKEIAELMLSNPDHCGQGSFMTCLPESDNEDRAVEEGRIQYCAMGMISAKVFMEMAVEEDMYWPLHHVMMSPPEKHPALGPNDPDNVVTRNDRIKDFEERARAIAELGEIDVRASWLERAR